ncbi:MAG: hypothetical protein GWP06_00040 [Actinobacteria bacterium]|nr:hypothetical protein [Actinomycetota bacterium]
MAVMNRMRENTKTILLILVFAFILTIIFSWGMGGLKRNQPRGIIASVNNVEISYEQFNERYRAAIQSQRDRTGSEPEGYQLRQIENQVFETLVQQILLEQEVKKLKLHATDQEILDEIKNNPPEFLKSNAAFKDSSGAFDMNKYRQALDNPAADWRPIENAIRSQIPRLKLFNLLRASVVVTDDDAKLEYMKNNAKAKVNYLFFDANSFTKNTSEPTEDEITTFYNKHKDEYREVEKRVLEYVLIDIKPTKVDTEATFKQAQDVLKEAKSGEDFAQLAKLYSQDTGSAEKGGDLGYFARGAMLKPFEEAAFAAKKGQIIGPIESQYGLHIIKVVDKKRVKGKEEVKASHILLKFEASPATREALKDEANYIAEYAKESDLATVVKAEGYEVKKTPPFAEEAFIPGIGMERRVNRWAFRSGKGKLSDVFYLDKGYLVASLADIIKKHIKPLDEMRTQIVNTLKTEKRMELAKAQCEAAYNKIKAGTPIDEVAADDSLKVKETDEFTMTGYVPGVGREPRFVGAAFALDIGEYSQPIEGTRGYYLLQVIDKKDIDEKAFESQKENLKKALIARKQQQLFGAWYSAIKKKAKIKDYRGDYL